MDANRIFLFVIFSYFSLFICADSVSTDATTTAEEKFTGSKTADNHRHPKIILFVFGTCVIGGKACKI